MGLVVKHLPDGVKRRLVSPYNRIQAFSADRAFRGRSLTDRSLGSNAPAHIVCIVVDALRADAVSRETTPFLATIFDRTAITPAPWTFPAVTSLLTGRYPHEHGAIRQSDASDVESTDLTVPPKLSEDAPALTDVFAGAGYDTYGGFAFYMPFFALSGRFATHAIYDGAPAERVLNDYLDWHAAARDRTFAYLHLGDPHEPIDPPSAYWRRHDVDRTIPNVKRWDYVDDPTPGPVGERYRRHRKRLYRASIDYVDDQLIQFHRQLSERLDGDIVFLVTGDHGEAFWEHVAFDAATFADSRPAYCVDHGGTPYESITRVPLGVDGIDIEGQGNGPVSLVDVAPTLLDALGLPDAIPMSGHVLPSGVPDDRVALVESTRYGHERKATYIDGWKLIVSKVDDTAVGFSLPEETRTDLPTKVERHLSEAMPPWPDGKHADQVVSGLARQRLEDLGYV